MGWNVGVVFGGAEGEIQVRSGRQADRDSKKEQEAWTRQLISGLSRPAHTTHAKQHTGHLKQQQQQQSRSEESQAVGRQGPARQGEAKQWKAVEVRKSRLMRETGAIHAGRHCALRRSPNGGPVCRELCRDDSCCYTGLLIRLITIICLLLFHVIPITITISRAELRIFPGLVHSPTDRIQASLTRSHVLRHHLPGTH